MTAQQLKNSILQLAVQGKLVPQDEKDEPASELLKRIKAEKEQLIKDKVIKKEKALPEIKEDELPFDIPSSWEWVRLGDVGETNIGLTYKPSDVTTSKGCAVMRSNNIQKGAMDYSDVLYVYCKIPDRAMSKIGDILICSRNGSRNLVGKSAIIDKNNLSFGAFMAIFRSICNPYIQVFINSYLFREQLDGAKTTTINQVTQSMLKNQICPIPPLAEQQRIVEKIEELLPLIEEYDKSHTQLEKLNKDFPQQIKKSILQWAVQGKLVEQISTDEPASELLGRIKAEKDKLIKDKVIKKEKALPNIEPDKLPFDIPSSWEWCRLGDICDKIGSGSTPTGGERVYVDKGIKFIRSQNVYDDGLHLSNVAFIPEHLNKSGSIVFPNDILLNITGGSIGRCVLIPNDFDVANINQHILIIRLTELDSRFWIHSVLISRYVQNMIMGVQVGCSREGLSATKTKNFPIPLPPLAEQKRIVDKIESVFSVVDGLC